MTDQVRRLEAVSARAVKAWERARPRWLRSDTARWLNDHSAGVLAWLRRVDEQAPAHSESMGRWLQENRPVVFRRAHDRLVEAGSTPKGFSRLTVLEALR